MKDSAILAIIVTVLVSSALCAMIDTSRTAAVEGTFAEYITHPDYQ
ncbi:hypothetical protein [uncultured Alistipes sp.]|nr:hypothetical protein [uncultured Alistipes sp.]